ncbi:TPA: hypothetical protein EYP70_07535 [Candidatus Bathyarchaeota archaeon]|nr:hypothetical protein [Candidatus Bathyarchaeota archaeon]
MLDEFKVLKIVIKRLDEGAIPYMITGSVAMNYFAQPRMTRDIDIVIEINENDVERIHNLFERDFYIDLDAVKNAVVKKEMFNVIHLAEVIKIDFIISKEQEFDKTTFQRRKRIKIDDMEMFLISIEDLILSKLLWSKERHSQIQLKDVRNLLQQKPDIKYIEQWIRKLGIEELWQEALSDSGGNDE